MSSQPNQSLIDGIRCLQYLASSDEPLGCRELARQLDMNPSKVNRLLMTMASIGLTTQDNKRRYLPGSGIHALGAQAMRSSNLFRKSITVLENIAPHDHIVALGVLWEDKVVYLYHSKPGQDRYEALLDYKIQPATNSVIGICLLAEHSDEKLIQLLGEDRLSSIRPLIEKMRTEHHVFLNHSDGELSMAVPIESVDKAALAFAGFYGISDEQKQKKLQRLEVLASMLSN
ncbi:helix-turn-helix domain-containing protein [Vibrio sp. SCSIO 43137]|uniref:helix-turn-helix domain-containing protein n=1 Tax=Vibrio sp. SCSIO 43137 TaxID=3021011 RepID=UPI002307F523|nr:helix-turn-helix domain-containing protein [Vibrio sp. SCSIO 43137]WCE29149.1 helix-turn-helix domain-containing protein [Vibrio sp. SCSIO 43137]